MQSVQEEKALAVQSLGAAKGELVAELGSLRAQNHKLTEDLAAVRPLHIYLYREREIQIPTHKILPPRGVAPCTSIGWDW